MQQARADPSKAAEIASLAQVRISAVHQQIDAMRSEEIKLLALRQAGAAKILILARVARIACVMATLWLAWLAYAEARKRLVEATTVKDDLARTVAMLEAEGRTRAEAEATVRQMQKMEAIGQLTGGIAHDFNNMLAVVIGSLEMANRRLGHDQAKAQLYITNAAEAASRAAQLTARLLAFARRQPLAPEPVDANRLVSGMSDLLERTLGEQMSVKTVLAEGLWLASVDPAQLENAILNLCVNGRDAMPDGGRLTVETSNCDLGEVDLMELQDVPAGPYVVIAVKDTGTGMTPDVVARAFDPFFTTKGVGKGTGLGLSQVFGFVKQSGGQVKILSDVGQGTCVRIYLPRYFGPVPTLACTSQTLCVLQ